MTTEGEAESPTMDWQPNLPAGRIATVHRLDAHRRPHVEPDALARSLSASMKRHPSSETTHRRRKVGTRRAWQGISAALAGAVILVSSWAGAGLGVQGHAGAVSWPLVCSWEPNTTVPVCPQKP